MRNTAIVETILTDDKGARLRVTDFAPRFDWFERQYRPPQIIRRIEPIAGLPRAAIRVRPTHAYGRPTTDVVVGSNHIRYVGGDEVMRLTTNAPLSYIVNEITFPLTRPLTLIFGQDEPFLTGIDTTSRDFLERTRRALVRMVAQPRGPVRMAVGGHPRRDHAEADELQGDRSDHRSAHDLDSRSAGVDAQLGLPVLLA